MHQELLIKRLQYRSGHRGCKETDLLFGKFSESNLTNLPPSLLAAYEKLLDEDDANIWSWLTDKSKSPAEYVELLAMMKKDVAGCWLLVSSCEQ